MRISRQAVVNPALAVLLICALMRGCAPAGQSPAGYREFSALPPGRQDEEFRTFPVEKQVDYFIYEYNNVHPFSVGFALTIAGRGDEVAPYLLRRMEEARGRDKLAVLYLLKITVEDGHLRDRKATLFAIREHVSKIDDPGVKASAEEMLKSMEGNAKPGE